MAGKPAVLKIDLRADTSQAKSELSGFDGFVAGVTASVTTFALNALSSLGTFALDFAKDTVDAGIKAAGAADALARVFQDSALAIVQAWSGVAPQTFGVVTTEFQNAATQFGRILQNMGVDQGRAANLITETAVLAADLATTYQISWGEAFDALSNAAQGKFRGIQQFTGKIGEDMVAQILADMQAVGGELATPAEQAEARLRAVFEKLGGITGAFQKSQEGAAGAATQAALAIEQLKTDIGLELMPALQELVPTIKEFTTLIVENKDTLLTLASASVVVAEQIVRSIAATIVIFGLFSDAIGFAHFVATTAFTAIADAANFVATIVAAGFNAVRSVIQGVVDFLVNQVERVRNLVNDLRGFLQQIPGAGAVGGVLDFLNPFSFAPVSSSSFGRVSSGSPVVIERPGATSSEVTLFGAVTGQQIVQELARYNKTTGQLTRSGVVFL